MDIKSNDQLLLNNIFHIVPKIIETEKNALLESLCQEKSFDLECLVHPFDSDILGKLSELLNRKNGENLYSNVKEINHIWKKLIEKSIKCLRFFDPREPYLTSKGKTPQSYGIEALVEYYDEFAKFEALLYGSNQFYRDHVIHLFRTWLIGINILINQVTSPTETSFWKTIEFEGEKLSEFEPNFFEAISIWTLIALCHDLGYPLEKFQSIIIKTQKMMEYLVSQPKIHQDISFSGIQDKINEFIIRMMSSKMTLADEFNEEYSLENIPSQSQKELKKKPFAARVQSKYYIKYSKSLESYAHGVVSSLIIYKSLLYFLESDYSFHDDYHFSKHDAKQFYIRRDILRGIASHTCKEIYHMKSNTFPLLLIISDELQEWGRKNWIGLYKNEKDSKSEFTLLNYDTKAIAVEYLFTAIDKCEISFLIAAFYKQFKKFQMLFRDGEDTVNREFSFYSRYQVTLKRSKKQFNITTIINKANGSIFKIEGINFKTKKEFTGIIMEKMPKNDILSENEFTIKYT